MSNAALETQGMTLAIEDESTPGTYNVIPECDEFTGPGGNAPVRDVSDLASTAKEKQIGLADEGQLSFKLFYLPTNTYHALLRAKRASRELKSFRITFTDSGPTTWTFDAYVMGFSINSPKDSNVVADVTLEITGSITEA